MMIARSCIERKKRGTRRKEEALYRVETPEKGR